MIPLTSEARLRHTAFFLNVMLLKRCRESDWRDPHGVITRAFAQPRGSFVTKPATDDQKGCRLAQVALLTAAQLKGGHQRQRMEALLFYADFFAMKIREEVKKAGKRPMSWRSLRCARDRAKYHEEKKKAYVTAVR